LEKEGMGSDPIAFEAAKSKRKKNPRVEEKNGHARRY
jgi:hypothetical protein